MKHFILRFLFLFTGIATFSQVGINTVTISDAAVLDIASSSDGITFGGFHIPHVTLAERNSIAVSAADDGLMVYLSEGDTRCVQLYNATDDAWENVFCMPVNEAPTADPVTITGASYDVGVVLTGTYTYADSEGDAEGTSTFQWYRADDGAGTNSTAIAGATGLTYTPQTTDIGSFLSFAVIPIATTGTITGVETFSGYGGPVDANDPPMASSVSSAGCLIVGETLTANYTYSDDEGDPEGASIFQWYRAIDAAGTGATAIPGATASTYTLQAADTAQFLAVEVTPVASSGASPGLSVLSAYNGPVLASGTCGPTLLAVQDFEPVPATPTLAYVENDPGTLRTGNGTAPATPTYIDTRSYGAQNDYVDMDFGPVDASAYTTVTLNLRLAAFSMNTSGNGLDGADFVDIYISTDGGFTFSYEMEITGNSNARYDFTATGTQSLVYDGDDNPISIATPTGSNGITFVELSGIPNSTDLVIGIVMDNDSNNELWVIDNVEVYGN